MELKGISKNAWLGATMLENGGSSGVLLTRRNRIQDEPPLETERPKEGKPWYFEKTNFIANLTALEKEQVVEISRLKYFNKGECLYLPDEPGNEIYLIKSGRVKSYLISHDGKEIILYIRYPGDIVGITAFCGIPRRTTYLETLKDTVVYAASIEDFYGFLSTRPHLMILLMKIMAARHHQAKILIQDLSINNAKKRLANFLLRSARERGTVLPDGLIRLQMDLSQEQIAQIIGTCRQTINRLLKSLRKEEFFQPEGRAIIIQEKKLMSLLEG